MKWSLISARLLALALCAALLTSCGPKPGSSSGSASGSGGSSSGSQSEPVPQPTEEERIHDLAMDRVRYSVDEAARIVSETPSRNESRKTFSFRALDRQYYAKLTDSQKKIYDDILPKVQNLEFFSYTAEEDGYEAMDDLLMASLALVRDYPLFDCYFNTREVLEGDMTSAITSLYFLPGDPEMRPLTTPEELMTLEEELKIFTTQCQLIVDGMPEGLSAYDQYRYLATYISLTTEYDFDELAGYARNSPYGAIQGGFSICQGYALGMLLLCQTADLWCTFTEGVCNGEAHGWNMVRLEDGTYHVDVTWSDASINGAADPAWFEYFMVTQKQIALDHAISDGSVATGTRSIESPYGPMSAEG